MIDKYDHPIFRPLWLQFTTPAVTALEKKITQWTRWGITGAIILGDPRTGKTTSIKMLLQNFKTPNGKEQIKTHLHIVTKRDASTIKNCHTGLLISTGMKIKTSYDTEKIFEQLIDYFCDLANENSRSEVILFVDECHRLSINQLNFFADLQNYLFNREVTLFVFFIGNKSETGSLLDKAKDAAYDHIRGRFFDQVYAFSGVKTQEELAEVLSQYDSLRYPDDGPTYTEFFLPEAFSLGWRLEFAAPLIWKTYQESVEQRFKTNWGMKYLLGTINPLLTDYLPQFSIEKINGKMIARCLELSGINFEVTK